MVTKEFLINFENEVAELFNAGKIVAPVHLYSGVEDQMIEVFREIDVENDWVCCPWRNHYQALLKGIPRDVVMQQILNGKSMVKIMVNRYALLLAKVGDALPHHSWTRHMQCLPR